MTIYREGIIAGSFDLIHPGYVRMFREAKHSVCYRLIVLLQDDPTIDRPSKNKPVQTWEERAEILSSLRDVDEVLRYSTEKDLYSILESKQGQDVVRILGSDYLGKRYTGEDLKISVYFCNRDHCYSLSLLKAKIKESLN